MGWEYVQRAPDDRQVRGSSRALLKRPFETSSGKCYRIFRITSRSRRGRRMSRSRNEGAGEKKEEKEKENENERIVGDTGGRKVERDGGTRKKSSRKAVKSSLE